MEAALLGNPQRLVIFIAVVIVALVGIDLYNRMTGKYKSSEAQEDPAAETQSSESPSDLDS